MDFRNFITAKSVAANYTEASSVKEPFLGESFFPAAKKNGMNLSWVKGKGGVPVTLAPSALDAKATFRTIGEVARLEGDMPFFREGFLISEKDRQELLRVKDENDPYLEALISNVYNFTRNLIDGASTAAERLRMALLFPVDGEMKIAIKANGVAYDYNYDASGDWKSSNYSALTTTALWSASTTADPIKDFITMADKAAEVSGTSTRYAIMSSDTFNKMIACDAVKNRFITSTGVKAAYLTPTEAIASIEASTGIRPIVYKKKFKDESGNVKSFIPDGYVSFIPDGELGKTWYGTTPEEADLRNDSSADVEIVNTGVAITRIVHPHPVNTEILASQIVLPSFERMDEVVTLKVTA